MSGKSFRFAMMAVTALFSATVIILAMGCRGAEQKSILDGIPQAAKEAILKLAGSNEVTGIELVKKDGVRMYKVEWMENGEEVEVVVDESGKLISRKVEEEEGEEEKEAGEITELQVEEIKLEEAPAAVQQTIKGEAGAYESIEVDHLRGEEKEYYEAEMQTAEGKESKLAVAVDGTVIGREEIRKVGLGDVPEAVKRAILKIVPQDKIEEVNEATVGGGKFFDVEFVKNGKEIKIRFSALGEAVVKFIEKENPLEEEDEQ